jgi:hypothetical protein
MGFDLAGVASSCRRKPGGGCRAEGWSTNPCRGRFAASCSGGRRGRWVRSRCRSGRRGWPGRCRTGCRAGEVLVGLEHGARLVVVHQQGPKAALGGNRVLISMPEASTKRVSGTGVGGAQGFLSGQEAGDRGAMGNRAPSDTPGRRCGSPPPDPRIVVDHEPAADQGHPPGAGMEQAIAAVRQRAVIAWSDDRIAAEWGTSITIGPRCRHPRRLRPARPRRQGLDGDVGRGNAVGVVGARAGARGEPPSRQPAPAGRLNITHCG